LLDCPILALLPCRDNIYFALLDGFIYVDGVKAALTKRVTGQKINMGLLLESI